MSKTIASDVIAQLGKLHFGRKKVQPSAREIQEFRDLARGVPKHPILNFKQTEFPIIADVLANTTRECNYTCYACAIMPDHVHILIRKHKHQAEDMLDHFQAATRLRLRTEKLRPDAHPVWGGPGWKVFLDTPDSIRRTIGYIDGNPSQWRLPRQSWPFVKEYDGWPLHPGHNPNSLYARRLRLHTQ